MTSSRWRHKTPKLHANELEVLEAYESGLLKFSAAKARLQRLVAAARVTGHLRQAQAGGYQSALGMPWRHA